MNYDYLKFEDEREIEESSCIDTDEYCDCEALSTNEQIAILLKNQTFAERMEFAHICLVIDGKSGNELWSVFFEELAEEILNGV